MSESNAFPTDSTTPRQAIEIARSEIDSGRGHAPMFYAIHVAQLGDFIQAQKDEIERLHQEMEYAAKRFEIVGEPFIATDVRRHIRD